MKPSDLGLWLNDTSTPPKTEPPTPTIKPRRFWAITFHVAVSLILALIAYESFFAGLQLRRQFWDQTVPIRFTGDVSNGFNWGVKASVLGYTHLYDISQPSSQLDYAPLRLWIMMQWANWAKTNYPSAYQRDRWNPKYEFNEPMLTFNTAMELASALAAFGLVWIWVRRRISLAPVSRGEGRARGQITGNPAPHPDPLPWLQGRGRLIHPLTHPWRGVARATAAALLIWFNPALIWNGHAWPQWDGWVVTFFLWGALLASIDAWFWAGAVIAIGIMCKGQTLAGAPVLLLWPLLGGQFKAAARFVIGLALAGALVLWPWLTDDPAAERWLYGVAGAMVAIAALALLGAGFRWPRRRLPLRHWPILLAAVAAAALWLCIPYFHADTAPLQRAFEYGANKFNDLARPEVNNLPSILQTHFHWKTDDAATTLRLLGTYDLTLKQLLWSVYALCVLLCGLAAAMQARRRDPRLLLALATPWILFFALLPQMHQRYLVWGAAITALAIGVDISLALLHGVITAAAWGMQAHSMLKDHYNFSPSWLQFLAATHPGAGYVVLLCGVIFLYVALLLRPASGAANKLYQ